jgi:2'-hydroxyisoflavone reductase
MVESAASFLKAHTKHYLYVSSIAAYDGKNYSQPGITEEASLSPWDGSERIYKRGKAESERRLGRIIGDRLTIVRPGPIKGDRDTATDLYTWLRRAQQSGKHIAPGDGNEYVQLVDVKDVARFLIQAIDGSLYGTYNLTGKPMTFREFLQNCRSAVHSDAEFVWVSRDFLKGQNVDSEGHMPLWRPTPIDHAVFQISSQKAFAAGWQPRPFNETAFDCLSYFSALDPVNGFDWEDPLAPAREKEVLKEWQRNSS